MTLNVMQFFDQAVSEYDELIQAAIPRYDEIFWAMFYYLPEDFNPTNILELGCGTGNLTRLIAKRWPESQITIVDISKEMLKETSQRLNSPNLTPIESTFEALAFPDSSFDLVMSSFSIHHMLDADKRNLFHQLAHWLKPDGFFVMGDMLVPESAHLRSANMQELERVASKNGASETHLHEWREHRQTLDHYASWSSIQQWLEEAQMTSPALLYSYLFNSVIQSQKTAWSL